MVLVRTKPSLYQTQTLLPAVGRDSYYHSCRQCSAGLFVHALSAPWVFWPVVYRASLVVESVKLCSMCTSGV